MIESVSSSTTTTKLAYPAILPQLDRPVGPVDAEGPAPGRGADGVAGLEAPSHSEGGFRGGARILEGDAGDGKLAGGGGERKRGEGNAGNLHDGWMDGGCGCYYVLRSCY